MVKKNKEAKSNNVFSFLLLLVVGICVVSFVFASHISSPTIVHTGTTNSTFDSTLFNISVNYTSDTGNLTQVNFTLPSEFTFITYTNGTNVSEYGYALFTNTSNVLSWTNYTSFVLNGTENHTFFWFNASIITPGTYNISISSMNETFTNFTNVTIMVNDTTVPEIVAENITFVTIGGNKSGAFSLSVSIYDNGNIETVIFNITNHSGVGGVMLYNATLSGSSWVNTSFSTTSFSEGKYNISVLANDTYGNENHSALVYGVIFDNTVPSVSLSSSSDTITSLTLTVEVSDALSGINTACTSNRGNAIFTGTGTTQTITETGLSCGKSYSYTVTCRDRAGNSADSAITSFSTDPCSDELTNGNGGGTTPSSTKITSWSKILPGEPTVVGDIDEDAGIKQIVIEVTEEVTNVKVTIKKYDEKPDEVAVAKPGTVYSYLEVETTNLEEQLAKATMTIQIKEDWLATNSIDKDDMALFKFNSDSSAWDELTTTYTESDEDYNYYEVELTSFSFFAIGEKQAVIDEREEEEEVEELKTTNLWLWIVVGILVLAAIIGGAIAVKKRKQ